MFKIETKYTFKCSQGYTWYAIIRKHPANVNYYSLTMYPSWSNKKRKSFASDSRYGNYSKLTDIRRMLKNQAKNIRECKPCKC